MRPKVWTDLDLGQSIVYKARGIIQMKSKTNNVWLHYNAVTRLLRTKLKFRLQIWIQLNIRIYLILVYPVVDRGK